MILRLTIAILVITLNCVFLSSLTTAQSAPKKRRSQDKFGSSLKRLKWDPVRRVAVETKEDAENERPATADEAIRVETNLVVFDVLVTDRTKSHAIKGLTKEDFSVAEDGRPQRIEFFAAGNDKALSRSITLILDFSGSLQPYREKSIEAAKSLVDKLAPADEMAIVTDEVELLAPFTRNKGRLKASLTALLTKRRGQQGSLQFTALLATLRELYKGKESRPIVIFQTDGDEIGTLRDLPGAMTRNPPPEYSLDDIYRVAGSANVTIYTVIPSERLIGLPSGELPARARRMLMRLDPTYEPYRYPDERVMKDIQFRVRAQEAAAHVANLTGGWVEFLETPGQADNIYSRILSDISERYIIGYYPTNEGSHANLRKVKIDVPLHSDYVIHGRQSYYFTGGGASRNSLKLDR